MVVAIVYINDAVFYDPSKTIFNKIKEYFMRKWERWDLSEATEFLYMHIRCHGCKILIDQCTYLDKIIKYFELQNANSTSIPLS